MVKRRCTLIVMLLVTAMSFSFAQNVQATARVDSNTIPIGGAVVLHLEVSRPENISIQWPQIPASLEGLEVVNRIDSSVQQTNHQVKETRSFHLTGFDSGTFYIPPFSFTYVSSGDTTKRTVETSAIPVVVHSVSVDTTQDLKDVKPPLSVSISFAEILPYLLVAAGLGIIAWLVYYLLKKRKKGEPMLPDAPARPAHELALEALRALDAEHLWQRGKVKEYQSQLTDILRLYIERKFNVMALEMTTEEILLSPAVAKFDTAIKKKLREILTMADFVKFAKFQPTPQEHEESMKDAFSIVESTWMPAVNEVSKTTVSEPVS